MNGPHRILVVDDEPHIRRLLHAALARSLYDVIEAADAAGALALLDSAKPDVVLLDLGLPDRDGLELVPLVRARSDAVLLVVSAREATEQKVAALDLGADDYVTKPFDTEEVLARVRTAIRHRMRRADERSKVAIGDVAIDLDAREVLRGGEEVHLTPKEFAFLAALARHPGRIVTHSQLLRDLWGPAHEGQVEYLRVVVRNLRRKLEADPAAPTFIINNAGVGYRLARA